MIALARIEGFDWDYGNSRKSVDKHAVTQAEAERVFFNEPLLILEDSKHSMDEPRFHALGRTDEARLLPSRSLCGGGRLVRLISARDMNRKERERYEQEA